MSITLFTTDYQHFPLFSMHITYDVSLNFHDRCWRDQEHLTLIGDDKRKVKYTQIIQASVQ
ncbi:hypothetical protein [Xanthocytophaga flava]|uniref:hypothetical protein n=1 Tax=Xanthocytophaga flava TaxID=3048013 RepID=UPI0028D018E2|nr:hypothetical protein [Xanthocytophaga flavus]